MAYKPKAPPIMAAPNVIPMADIMLVLLIIFMVVTPMLQKGVSVDLDKTVFVRSDSRAKYGDVVKAVDEVRSAGVDHLGLLTEKIRGKGTAAPPPPPPAD